MLTPDIRQMGNRYHFSMEKPTQSVGEKILIEQSNRSLKVYLQKKSEIFAIQNHMLIGLPEDKQYIPRDFFEHCYIKVSTLNSGEHKIHFSQPLKGGMLSASKIHYQFARRHFNQKLNNQLFNSFRRFSSIKDLDPKVFNNIEKEFTRQSTTLGLIASENVAIPEVLEAQGTCLTNKVAEGLPEKRYYGGCKYLDNIEKLAIKRACSLFGAEHANIQPNSGALANMAAYFAVLNPGDTVLAMHLSHGGHLTHGANFNISGKCFNFVYYGVSEHNEQLNYQKIRELALKHRPKMIVAGASSYSRRIDFEIISSIAKECSAIFLVDMAHIAGLIAAGLHPDPIPYADIVTTTCHKTLRGPKGGIIFCKEKWAHVIDRAVFPCVQGAPFPHVLAAKAVMLKFAQTNEFKEYQKEVLRNAHALAQIFIKKGFTIVSGGTDNHMMLVNTKKSVNVTGKSSRKILEKCNIIVNENLVPFDKERPQEASGIRIGTPLITARGMLEKDMEFIAERITTALTYPDSRDLHRHIRQEVCDFLSDFPIYQNKNKGGKF